MVRAKGHKEILSPAEKQTLMEEKRELEQVRNERKEYGIGTSAEAMDTAKIDSQIKRLDQTLADGEAPKVRSVDKDKIIKELADLERDLQVGLPTRDEMRKPGDNPGAVRKHMGWVERNMKTIERYRYLQRLINPYDPKSVESLRKEK